MTPLVYPPIRVIFDGEELLILIQISEKSSPGIPTIAVS